MPNYAQNANAYAKALRDEMDSVYTQAEQETPTEIKDLFLMVGPKDDKAEGGRYDDYYIPAEMGTFRRWKSEKGEQRSFQSTTDYSKRLYTMEWQNGVEWRVNDERDDRTSRKFTQRAKDAGQDRGMLLDRVAAVLITGTADNVTLETADIPTAIDGYSFYSASHAEHANGNVHSGGGVATTSAIKTDWFAILQQFTEMKNPLNKQPYFPTNTVQRASFTIFVSPANFEIFSEAFELENRFIFDATATQAYAGNVQNILKSKFGQKVNVVTYNRITGNDWYVFMNLPGKSRKPFIWREVQDLEEHYFDENGHGFMTKSRGISWDIRAQAGYLNHNLAIKNDN